MDSLPKRQAELKPLNMEAFKAEIEDLISERREGTSTNMTEFLGIDPDDLTEADAAMWYRFENNYQITPADYYEYEKEVIGSGNLSRGCLRAIFANKLMGGVWNDEELNMFSELTREERSNHRKSQNLNGL